MFDVNRNPIPEYNAGVVPEDGAETLLQACERFAQAFNMWELLMKEASHSILPCENMTHAQLSKTKQQWQRAFAQVRSLPARHLDGLDAKRRVLETLSYFGETGDPSFLAFAVELVDEYHKFIFE